MVTIKGLIDNRDHIEISSNLRGEVLKKHFAAEVRRYSGDKQASAKASAPASKTITGSEVVRVSMIEG